MKAAGDGALHDLGETSLPGWRKPLRARSSKPFDHVIIDEAQGSGTGGAGGFFAGACRRPKPNGLFPVPATSANVFSSILIPWAEPRRRYAVADRQHIEGSATAPRNQIRRAADRLLLPTVLRG